IISMRSSPGFNPANVMVAQVSLPKTKYAQESQQRNFGDAVLARVRALPGVTSAGAASFVPFGAFGQTVEVEAVGKPAPQPREILGARFTAASPDYFAAMQIGLLKGRMFTAADGPGNAIVALIDQTLARQFWPNEDPIGQKLKFGEQHTVCTIVGVVNDVKMYQLRGRPEREMYVPLAQFPSATLGLVARTAGNPTAMPAAIREAIWAEDADQPVSSVEQLETLMAVQDAGNRVMTKLMVFFGVLALFLCAIGIYGVMAHTVAQRTHEIGIRMALGANSLQVMGMVVGQALRLTFIGIAIGIAGAFAVTRSLAVMLYQVNPGDPATFVGAAVLFAMVATAACYIPARLARKVDPMVALRYE
ncbi:MAG: FtsX-like permease family protein, partial [Candidatus Acidiferrales bacterium]